MSSESSFAASHAHPTVVALGAHVLDTQVYPVTEIPSGQQGQLVERIAMSAAGPAGGTAVVLARLGVRVRSAGAVGADPIGDLLLRLLGDAGVDVELMRRISGVQTSASVLPIRPDGSRPAFHVLGANLFAGQDVPWDAIAAADHLHLGAPELLGDEAAAQILAFAKKHGCSTSVDSLAPGQPEMFDLFSRALPEVDYLLPNDEQAVGWTGATDLEAAVRRLQELGAGTVAATAGADPTTVALPDGRVARVPTLKVDVVDTTGAGDSFSAGFVRGMLLGQDALAAAELGNATAALTVQGIGSGFGTFDLPEVLALAADVDTCA